MRVRTLSVLGLGVMFFTGCASFNSGRQVAEIDNADLKVGDVVRVDINDLHPTQFRVGEAEVNEKAKKFEGMNPDQLEEYLKSHPCPVVIGPGGVPYITDEQHRANASEIAESSHSAVSSLKKHGQPTMYMKVIANWSKLSPSEFKDKMVENHYTYLNDLGAKRSFDDLPNHVDDMKDDPYRSIAGFLENKAWDDSKPVYFSQFQVAQWLREHLKMTDGSVRDALDDPDSRKALLKKASALLQSKDASSEPWYLES